MKRTIILIFLAAFATASTLQVSGQKADFNGSWKSDIAKSTLVEYANLVRIDVQIKGDSLLTERYYDTGDGQIYPFTENLTLDGKEYNITIYDMPRKTKATWSDQDGSVILESTITFNGDSGPEDFESKETWKVDKENNILVINFKNQISMGESEGSFFFNKAEEAK